MLDSTKDSHKLDAMKRIISMLAKGRDVSDLFTAVVKNVASKNIEAKKLVYVFPPVMLRSSRTWLCSPPLPSREQSKIHTI